MTPTILGDKAADSVDRAAGTLVQSFGEFNGAAARLMFPPEGYSKADFIGLTTDFQIASLRLWLAAVEAPVRMIAGVSLPSVSDVAAALSPAPVMENPSPPKALVSKPATVKPEAVAKPAASRPTGPVAKKPITPSSDVASTVVPFRRAEAPKPEENIAPETKAKTASVPKDKTPETKSSAAKTLAPANSIDVAKSPVAAKTTPSPSTSTKPAVKPVVAPSVVAPPVAAKSAPKSAAANPVAAIPVTATPIAIKPEAPKAEPPKAALPKPQPAAKGVGPAGDFDDASVAATAPAFLAAPEGKADDLLIIKGIGPKLNQLLHDLGIWHYRQIANWTPGEIAWINAKLDFKGRVQRERWVMQARELAGKSAA